jgi:outer membrane receptor for ferrienterochelin and colicin
MALRSLIMLLVIFYGFHISQGQDSNSYSLDILEGTSLKSVINYLEETYGYQFAYQPEIVDKEILSAAMISADTREDFMIALLHETELEFIIQDEEEILIRSKIQYYIDNKDPLIITGVVTDAISGIPLAYASVLLDSLGIGTGTDSSGRFQLSIPSEYSGRTLHVSSLSYNKQVIPVKTVVDHSMIRLYPSPYQIDEIYVTGYISGISLHSIRPGIESNNVQQISGNASSLVGEDILRTVQLLPGVDATNDVSSGIKIRGSNDDETLIVLDGIPIYRSDHYYGIFSSVNSIHIEKFQLFKNALPIEYGGKTGGMLLLESKSKVDHFQGQIDANLLSSSINLHIPISEKTGMIVSGRTSHGNAAESKFFDWVGRDFEAYQDPLTAENRNRLVQTSPRFNFYDLNTKLILDSSTRHQLNINLFRSNDHFINEYEKNYPSRYQGNLISNREIFLDDERWSNTGLSFNDHLTISPSTKLSTSGYFSKYSTSGFIESSLLRMSGIEDQLFGFRNDQSNAIEEWGLSLQLKKEILTGQSLSIGVGVSRKNIDHLLAIDDISILEGKQQSTVSVAFLQYLAHFNDRWLVDVGLRTSVDALTGSTFFSPRLNTDFRITTNLKLKGSMSIHHQLTRELIHENRLGQVTNLFVLSDTEAFTTGKSTNFMIGAGYRSGDWSFDVEMFNKSMVGVLEFASQIPGFNPNQSNPSGLTDYKLYTGTGNSIGIDVMVSVQKRSYEGWVAYTLSKTTHRFKEIFHHSAFPSENDRRHQVKWINMLTLSSFRVSANFIASSGKPYTDLKTLKQSEDRRNLSPEERLSYLPAYSRIDIGAEYSFNIGDANASAGISVFNLTNRNNVQYIQQVYNLPGAVPGSSSTVVGTETNLLDRTLNLSLKLEF